MRVFIDKIYSQCHIDVAEPLTRSQSVEEIPHRDDVPANENTSWSLEKKGGRRVTHQYQFKKEEEKEGKDEEKKEEQEEDSADGPSRQFRLDGLRRFRPSINEEQGGNATGQPALQYGSGLPTFVFADGLDDVGMYLFV